MEEEPEIIWLIVISSKLKTQQGRKEVAMSLDKAILHGKEHRKPYIGGKSIDRTCRNHGNCDWCKDNRLHASKVQKEIADAKLAEYEEGGSG